MGIFRTAQRETYDPDDSLRAICKECYSCWTCACLSGDTKAATQETGAEEKSASPISRNRDEYANSLKVSGTQDAPLLEAAYAGDADGVNALLAKGVDVRAKDDQNRTALFWVAGAEADDAQLAASLLSAPNGLDLLNMGSVDNSTPLMLAAACGNSKVLKLLLEKGADATFVDQDGKTAVWHADDKGNTECVAVFKEYGIEPEEQAFGSYAIGAVVLAIVCLAVGCSYVVPGRERLALGDQSLSWPSTECTVVRSDCESAGKNAGVDLFLDVTYQPRIGAYVNDAKALTSVNYIADGNRASRFSIGAFNDPLEECRVERIRFAVGSTFKCWYSPDNTQYTITRQYDSSDTSSTVWSLIVVGALLLVLSSCCCCCSGLFFNAYRVQRREKAGKESDQTPMLAV